MTIRIIITGGTFDKEYNEHSGELFFDDSHISEMLTLGRSRVPINISTAMMIDSLDMTDSDRDAIVLNILNADENNIVITHGTDTMVETAQVLAKKITEKTIVLTGAMVPYKFGSSDGLFNLGSAIAYAQSLPSGVYIAMNGRYFTHDNCRKNKNLGEFEEIRSV